MHHETILNHKIYSRNAHNIQIKIPRIPKGLKLQLFFLKVSIGLSYANSKTLLKLPLFSERGYNPGWTRTLKTWQIKLGNVPLIHPEWLLYKPFSARAFSTPLWLNETATIKLCLFSVVALFGFHWAFLLSTWKRGQNEQSGIWLPELWFALLSYFKLKGPGKIAFSHSQILRGNFWKCLKNLRFEF